MARVERIIVGYPEGDPRIGALWSDHGRRALPHKRCIGGCGRVVYFVESGQDAIRSRDPEPICEQCWQRPDIKRDIYAHEL